ncbi:MAG: amidohydrolase family protein [Armatimonadota bacterium]|nr:amidohydrolase family protein [Armatimonadota bacterium]
MDEVLRAAWVFPVEGPPIQDGAVWVSGGRIEAVGSCAEVESRLTPGAEVRRKHWTNGAIIPGFVNTHAHLELSAMQGQIPRPAECGEDFTGWIRRLLAIREGWSAEDFAQSIRMGIRLLAKGGTTTVGDVTTDGSSLAPLIESGLRAVVFREALGFGLEREAAAHEVGANWLAKSGETLHQSNGRVRLGLSPHAPHSTSPAIYRDYCQMAAEAGCLVATHVSETREELEFIERGTGVFRRLLDARGLSLEGWEPSGKSSVGYLQDLGVLKSEGLAVHNNYLLPGDLDILSRSRLTPVYCPQSHVFLGHSDHPAVEMIKRGIPLALGTDSLASNGSLEILDEIRLAYAMHPEVSPEQWLRCATLNGARALRQDATTGSLVPGKMADIAAVALPVGHERDGGDAATDPYERLLSPGSHVVGTMVGGEWVSL